MLVWGSTQDRGAPHRKPATLPEGAPADPFLLVPLSALFLQLLTLARAKTGLGKAGLTRPFTSTALELCHWPAVATILAPPVPRAMSAVLWLHHVCELGADSVLVAWLAEHAGLRHT